MANKTDESVWLTTGSLVILAAATLAFILHYTSIVMIPFVLAVFTVVLVSPLLDFQIIRLKFPRAIAVIITLIVALCIIVVLCIFISQAVHAIVSTVGQYTDSFATLAERIFSQLQQRWHIEVDADKIISSLKKEIPSLATNTLGRVLQFASTVFFVVIFVIFLLSGRNPDVVHTGVYADIDQKVRRYVATKVFISTLTGLAVWATLAILGLQLAGVFGMLAFLLNFIPSIGSVISTLLPIPIAVAQFSSGWMILPVVAVPGIIQMILGNVIEPKLMGRGLNLHPITILMALLFWGLLWGIAGMLLAAPMTAAIRIILMQFETLKPLAGLLAGELPNWQTDKS